MLDLWQWAIAGLAALLVGVSKTGIAGLGVLSVAIFASILPARESVGIVLVVLLSADLVAVTVYRRDASWPHLWRLFPWTAVGVVFGAALLGRIDEGVLRVLIGGIVLTLVVIQFMRRGKAAGLDDPTSHPLLAVTTGLLAGFTTMIANAAGPVMILYLLSMRLPKLQFIGTAAWFFLVVNLFKVPFSVSLGLISATSLPISLRLVPVAILGALSGRWLISHINQSVFEMLALGLTLVAGVRLLFG